MIAIRKFSPMPEGIAARSAGRMKRLDPLVAKMYADYQRGLSLKEVGRKHGRREDCVWHLFKVRGLPCRPKPTPEVFKKIAATRRAKLDALVQQMHADYMRPMTLHEVGRKYGRSNGAVRELFACRGLYIRPFKLIERQPNGSPVRYTPYTPEQVEDIIARTTTFAIPAELKFEWRAWSLERRADFVRRLREHLGRPNDRPPGPFSANVEPFDYGTPRAHEIARRMNAGRTSRDAAVLMMIQSHGVIYKERLYFWAADGGGGKTGAYYIGPWRPGIGRPSLHRLIWEEYNGRPVPKGHVVRHRDGNLNNLAPENLVLATRNQVARENQAAALTRKSRERTAALLNHARSNTRHDLAHQLLHR